MATKSHHKVPQLSMNRNQYTQRYPRHLPNLRAPNLYQKPRNVPGARDRHEIMIPHFYRLNKNLLKRKESENLSNTSVYKYFHNLYYQRSLDSRKKLRNNTYLHGNQDNPRYLYRSEHVATGTFDTLDDHNAYSMSGFRRGKRVYWLGHEKDPY